MKQTCYNETVKSQVIKTRNLPEDLSRTAYEVHVKPWWFLIIVLVADVFIMILKPYMISLFIPLVILTLFAIFGMPDKVLVQFTPDYLVMYNRKSKDECTLVYWDEVVSWVYEYHNAADVLKLELIDGSIESVEMYSKRSVRKKMNLYAKDKEKKRRNGSAE